MNQVTHQDAKHGAKHDTNQVTVIGLGPMGRAMAAAYLDAGYEVTVWNRSPGKDTELVARGARRAATPPRRSPRAG